jgi:hypothetical protein
MTAVSEQPEGLELHEILDSAARQSPMRNRYDTMTPKEPTSKII